MSREELLVASVQGPHTDMQFIIPAVAGVQFKSYYRVTLQILKRGASFQKVGMDLNML